jgi:hypothetical protein
LSLIKRIHRKGVVMPLLTAEQLGFFARNGFLHVPRLIDEDTCRRLVDLTWTRFPAEWKRDDPSTWYGTAADSCHVADLRVRRGLFQFQRGDLYENAVIERAFAAQAAAGQLARELIGHPLAKMRVRGLYCIVPLAESVRYKTPVKPHIEAHAAQLIALCYLEDVAEGAGGLSVWPGSHREVYPAMGSKLEHVPTPAYDQMFSRWAGLQPIEIPGQRGDIVIIHHRLLHAPSLNRGKRMRYGFLCDYQRDDFRSLSTAKPGANMWEDWPAIEALRPAVRDGAPLRELRPVEGQADVVPLHSASYRMSLAHALDTDPSSVRKADASVLARSRREGDIWLALSDEACTADDTELLPRGSDLAHYGVRVRVDGKPVASVCRYDIIARLQVHPGEHLIELEGLPRPAWLRVLRLKLPFIRTEFLARYAAQPGKAAIRFHVPESGT